MAIGICPQCRGRFVVEDVRSFQRTCPACLRPMELSPSVHGGTTAAPTAEAELLWLNDAPLAVDELGQRVMAAIAEAAYQQSLARAERQASRERRGDVEAPEADAEEPLPRLSPAAPEAPLNAGPDPDELHRRAATLVERALASCLEAKILRSQARLIRESRRSLPDELSLLPPLDYCLLPFGFSLPALEEEPGPEELGQPVEAPLALPGTTTLYVWGYNPPTTLLCRERCESSVEAAVFARKTGWDPGREGAWAKEITVPGGLRDTLRALEPILRQDQGVVGWGARTRRRPGGDGPARPIEARPGGVI